MQRQEKRVLGLLLWGMRNAWGGKVACGAEVHQIQVEVVLRRPADPESEKLILDKTVGVRLL